MALEIAPAPAKQPAAASTARSHDSKPDAVQGKGKPKDPASFLALLLDMDLEPAADVPTDLLPQDAALPDAEPKDADADLLNALPGVVPQDLAHAATPIVLPQPAHAQGPHTDALTAPHTDGVTLDLADKPGLGARRRNADSVATMGTQQLQTELAKPGQDATTKPADATAARESVKPSVVEAMQQQAAQIVLPSAAADEARKTTHGLQQVKIENADNLVLLSGLQGAISTTHASFDVSAPGAVAQFQSVVADEVAYYISNDVQNAEMKLEGVGGGPVEVSINMQGKEAQVVFRTDEVQTRAMLEGASTQLKDMLQQQGVVLTGVYVGTSGAGGDAQAGERKFRQGGRGQEASLRIAATEVRGASTPQNHGVGRTLDLYV